MSRIIDVICENNTYETAVQRAKNLVEEHLVVVTYIIPTIIITSENDQVIEKETTMLILKSKDIVFRSKLLPRLKELDCHSCMSFPIIDVVPDYRAWVEEEVYE